MKYIAYLLVIFNFSCASKKEEKKIKSEEGWLAIYNANSARIDFKKGDRRILCYGLRAMMIPLEQNDSLCKAYNFYEFEAAGCEVTAEFMNGANVYNTEMIRLLEQINGKGWFRKYLDEFDALAKKERDLEEMELFKRDSVSYKVTKGIRDSIERAHKKELEKKK